MIDMNMRSRVFIHYLLSWPPAINKFRAMESILLQNDLDQMRGLDLHSLAELSENIDI